MSVPASIGEHAGQGREPVVQRAPVGGHAVVARIEPGDHRAAARATDLVRGVVASETGAARRERVDVRRPRLAIARTAEAIAALLIGAQNDEVDHSVSQRQVHRSDHVQFGG